MNWQDCSTYSQGSPREVPTAWAYKAGVLVLIIHKHNDFPEEQWLLSCEPFFTRYILPHADIEDCKEAALYLVSYELRDLAETFFNQRD